MHLSGKHVLNAPASKIWNLLLDPEILAKITPGITRLEATGNDEYDAIADVKIGPVNGSFSGKMAVTNKIDKEGFTLLIQQNSKIGNVNAEGTIKLNPLSDTQTEVDFSGDAKISGTLARTGQRVISGVAKMLTKQFFKALEEEVENA